MLTAKDCYTKYGPPEKELHMILFDVQTELEIGTIPKRIYCNKDMVEPLTKAFKNLIDRKIVGQLKTWDGCFNVRLKRGAESLSLHSWGVAVDVNAAWNRFGARPSCSIDFVKCFTDAGFDWGGDWQRPDGMHFELHKLP